MVVIRIRLNVDQSNQEAFVKFLSAEVERNKILDGCMTYTLYQDAAEPHDFLLYEEWENMTAFERYKNSAEFKKIMATVAPLLACAPDSVYYESNIVGPN